MKRFFTRNESSSRDDRRKDLTSADSSKSRRTQPGAAGRKHRRRVLVLATLLSGLVVFGGYALLRGYGESSGTDSRRAPAGFGSVNSRLREWLWPAKARATYRIEQSINLEAGDADMVPDACGLTVLTGRLHVCLLEVNAKNVTLAMQLSDVSLTTGDTAESERRREPVMESMLNDSPGLVRLGRDGRLLSCDLPATLAGQDRAMLEGIFAIEFVLGRGMQWQTNESMHGLQCLCRYRAESGDRIVKSREALAGPEGQPSRRIVQSGFTAVAGSFWLESLSGGEKFECSWKGKSVCTADTSMKLSRLPEATIPESLLALAADPAKRAGLVSDADFASHSASRQASARERQRRARLVEMYGSVPASKMMDDLAAAVAAAEDHAATLPAMQALRDWLLANPARSAEVAEALKNPALTNEVTARAAHALESAGRSNPQSQAALAAILVAPRGTYPPAVLMQAAVAAGGVGAIQSPELTAALKAAVASENPGEDFLLNDAALYALGTLTRDNPELRPGLMETLSPRLAMNSDTSPEDTATALRTLANAGIQETAVMEQALALSAEHDEPGVRIAAIDYFAASGEAVALQAITRAVTGDPSEDVRRRAVEVLTSPELASPETLRPVLGLLGSDSTSGSLQEFAITSLARHQAALPEIRQSFLRLLPTARGDAAGLIREAVSSPL
jgi:HEAT repeats